jgi:hypothetical protein
VVELEEVPPASPEAKRNPFTRRVSFSDPHIFRNLEPNERRIHDQQQKENWINDWRWRFSLIEDDMSFVWTTRFRRFFLQQLTTRILATIIAVSAIPMQVILIIGLARDWSLHCDVPLQGWYSLFTLNDFFFRSIVILFVLFSLQLSNVLLAKKLPPDYAPPDIRQYR